MTEIDRKSSLNLSMVFIEQSDLSRHIERFIAKGGRIFDCRFRLAVGEQPAKGLSFYHESHIPFADYLDLESDLSGPVDARSGRHPWPQNSQWVERFNVNSDQPIIVYDSGNLAFAARAWAVLRAAGFTRVRILKQGFVGKSDTVFTSQSSRTMSAMATEQSHFEQWFSSHFKPVRHPIEFVAKHQLSDCGRLIDAREADRFKGLVEPIDPIAGCIPHSINMPWTHHFESDGKLKPDSDIRTLWQQFEQIHGTGDWTHYCGSGVTALVNFIFASLYTDSRQFLYVGGWSEYCRQ